jgi:hypothetical protein
VRKALISSGPERKLKWGFKYPKFAKTKMLPGKLESLGRVVLGKKYIYFLGGISI